MFTSVVWTDDSKLSQESNLTARFTQGATPDYTFHLTNAAA